MHPAIDTYPFLSEIPDNVRNAADLDALFIPQANELTLIRKLSAELNKNVVVYRKDYLCQGAHLCRILLPASLTSLQLDRLNVTENLFSGQVIVAYEKPLAFARSFLPDDY